ncbi:thiamine phosphate synthase [uncultured Clostridium sp.]|uniref:thiamine phosphate synthase n=1 Tax=uncultured Clostridium sp. TaxID=59620 RepID=UPI00262AC13F|nr:thiamine phosphate synthase [uncultured Clostridium sp.]
MRFSERKLYLVTDENMKLEELLKGLDEAIKSGVSVVQYRAKSKSVREMVYEANMIKEICRKHRVIFLVNDRIDIAIAVNADGVHLGKSDMRADIARSLIGENKIIGLTVDNKKMLSEIKEYKLDYITVGKGLEGIENDKIDVITEENMIFLRDIYKGNIYGTYGMKSQFDRYDNKSLIDGLIGSSSVIFSDLYSDKLKKKIEKL